MNNLWKVAWTHVAWVSILSEKQFLTESVKKCSWWCCLMTRQRVGCGQTQRRSLWEVSTEWGVLTPGRGTKCHVRLQGVPGIQRWESHGVVCSQGCALIFIHPSDHIINLPGGLPFPPHTPNPVYNHKGKKGREWPRKQVYFLAISPSSVWSKAV